MSPPTDPPFSDEPTRPAFGPAETPTQAPPMRPSDETAAPGARGPSPSDAGLPRRVEPGVVLNGIYRVVRLIARGGMGEVFEGVNVHDERQRVAIKVVRPSLADDANMEGLFRREANTLEDVSHPAVVKYVLVARDPVLDVLYYVMEYIDGESLSEVVGRLEPSAATLRPLLERLAGGLQAAHARGVVHRDLSPDNVLLPGGRLADAKIIDFGIAKSLKPGEQTISGGAFAGKLGYAAPEQLGLFGGEVDAWSDVYSLALVILTLAVGRNLDMGATLADAVERRRSPVDVSAAPAELRPLLSGMLEPDPRDRLRSMGEVLAFRAPEQAEAPAGGGRPRETTVPAAAGRRRIDPLPLLLGGGAVVAVAGIAAVLLLARPHAGPAKEAEHLVATGSAPVATAPGAPVSLDTIQARLDQEPCAWVTAASRDGGSVRLTGASRGPPSLAESAATVTDASGILPIRPGSPVCAVIDTLKPLAAPASGHLTIDTAKFAQTSPLVMRVVADGPSDGFQLYSINPDGTINRIANRRQLDSVGQSTEPVERCPPPGAGSKLQGRVDRLPDYAYRLTGCVDHMGVAGVLLLRGPPQGEDFTPTKPCDIACVGRMAAWAGKAGWRAETAWYEVSLPSGPPPSG